MANLVLLRELVRNDRARGHSGNIDSTAAWAGFGSLLESVIVRASIPYSPVDIALFFSVMGVKTIHACARSATDLTYFTRAYTNGVGKIIHLEIKPPRYPTFTSAIERVRLLALRTSPQLLEKERANFVDMVTRPYALIIRDRATRTNLTSAPATTKRKRRDGANKSRSPRTLVTFSGPS